MRIRIVQNNANSTKSGSEAPSYCRLYFILIEMQFAVNIQWALDNPK